MRYWLKGLIAIFVFLAVFYFIFALVEQNFIEPLRFIIHFPYEFPAGVIFWPSIGILLGLLYGKAKVQNGLSKRITISLIILIIGFSGIVMESFLNRCHEVGCGLFGLLLGIIVIIIAFINATIKY